MNPQILLPYASHVTARLPRRWVDRTAEAVGDVAARCLPGVRRVIGANVELATGGPVADSTRRRALATYARYYAGLMRLAHCTQTAAVGPIHCVGERALALTLARGRGALTLGAHLGNWDAAAVALAQRFGSVHAFAEPLRPARLLRFYTQVRARHQVHVLPVGAPGRAPFTVLRDNGILGVLIDRPYGKRCVRVPFGSGALELPTGAIRIGLRAGAGIHPVFCTFRGDGCVLHVGEDLARGLGSRDESECVRCVARGFAAALQAIVRRYPDQWCLLMPVAPAPGLERGAA